MKNLKTMGTGANLLVAATAGACTAIATQVLLNWWYRFLLCLFIWSILAAIGFSIGQITNFIP